MQSLFIFDIIFVVHHITFDILYLIAIINIHHHYSWDLLLYFIFNCYHLIFSIIFTLIHMWHFLYIGIWLSFSWPAHFDEAYIKVLNTSLIDSWMWDLNEITTHCLLYISWIWWLILSLISKSIIVSWQIFIIVWLLMMLITISWESRISVSMSILADRLSITWTSQFSLSKIDFLLNLANTLNMIWMNFVMSCLF